MDPLLPPLTAFTAAFAVMLALAFRGWRVYASLAVMVAVYAVLAATPSAVAEAASRLVEWNDLRVFVYIFFSMLLAGVMKESGLLNGMVESLSAAGCRLSLTGIPALIGLMPMPGGALVSAIAMRDKYFKEAGLSREDATFINYWFRHIWVPSWPLFQSVLITASVFQVEPTKIIAHTWPGTLAAIIGGLAVAGAVIARARCEGRGSPWGFLAASSPLILLAALVLSGINLLEALIIVNIVTLTALRPGRESLRRALGLALRPTIHLVLLESLLFKNLLIATKISGHIAQAAASAGIPAAALAFATPFILGMTAGGENFFAATAMPMLYSYIAGPDGVDWSLLYISYLGGFLGVMMSPVHLCLALTVDYYEAKLSSVMARVALAVTLATLAGIALSGVSSLTA